MEVAYGVQLDSGLVQHGVKLLMKGFTRPSRPLEMLDTAKHLTVHFIQI